MKPLTKLLPLLLLLQLLLVAAHSFSQGTWTAKANFGGVARVSAAGFAIGDTVYIGTGNTNATYVQDFWRYNPATDTWTQRADFPGAARGMDVGFNIGNYGYIGMGRNGGYPNDLWRYDPAINTWTAMTPNSTASMRGAVAFVINNKAYVGVTGTSYGQLWEYDPAVGAGGTWTRMTDHPFGTAIYGFAAGFAIGNKGYVGTGNTPNNNSSFFNDFYEYDPAVGVGGRWTRKMDYANGGATSWRAQAIGFAINGKGYIGAGEFGGTNYSDFWEYDPNDVSNGLDVNGNPMGNWNNCVADLLPARTGAVAVATSNTAYVGTGGPYGCSWLACGKLADFWKFTPGSCGGISALATPTSIKCNGTCTGTATVTVTGGTAPFTYSWSPSGGNSSVATGLCAITYTVLVTDATSATANSIITVSAPTVLATPSVTSSPSSCGNPGSATITSMSGGTPAYTYLWSNSQTSTTATNLAAGNYTVTVTDNNQCTKSNTVTVASTGSVTATAPPTTICSGQTATLTASGGATYLWSTTSSATTSAITVNPTVTTTYTVTVSSGGCSDKAYPTVTVNQVPKITAAPGSTLCIGKIATLTASNGSGTYSWSNSATTPSITANANATYTVTSNGCTDNITLAFLPQPVASAPSKTICSGENATLTAAAGGANYLWSTASSATTASIVVSPTVTTSYTVTVSSGSCSDKAYPTVTVNPSPKIQALPGATLCIGETVTLNASGGGPYTWSTGSNATSISTNVSATYSVTSKGCTDSIKVAFLNPPIANAVSATVCSGGNAILTATGGLNYLWNTGATATATAITVPASITVTPLTTTTYTVTAFIGTCSNTTTATVSVNQNPVAAIQSYTTSTVGSNTTLVASATTPSGGGVTYLWTHNNATTDSVTVNPAITTKYCVTTTDSATGCSVNACEVVVGGCSNTGELFLPDAFSPNYDGENDTLRIYYGNYLCIKSFHIAIYDRWGEIIFQSTEPTFKWEGTQRGKWLDPAVFAYYLNLTFIDGTTIDRKGNISLMK
ncbi:MAG: gliding motility-associated C-terminal domain-containing protein [Bacteroidetes bacterium]|nr:gliding motility-associated C-terminal domain-containing protein [Bacteroidota bacterium]